MAKFKQTQVYPGVTKTRSNAVKVYCSEAVTAGDILCVKGVQGDFISVQVADAAVAAERVGPMWVADYAAASGSYTAVAVPWKVMDVPTATSGAIAVNDPIYLDDGGVTGATTDKAAGTGTSIVGRFLEVRSSGNADTKGILWPVGQTTLG
jgi:hypothetical protein